MCKFAGYARYLKHLLPENKLASLSSFLFDENVQKVVEELLIKACTWRSFSSSCCYKSCETVYKKKLYLMHKNNVLFIPVHLCNEINSRCFKCIRFSVRSVMFVNNFYVHFIWSFVNKTFICSITSCIPFTHPISEEVFVHSKFYIVCFFYYRKHCTFCSVSWQIQGLCDKAVVFGEVIKRNAVFCIFKGYMFL